MFRDKQVLETVTLHTWAMLRKQFPTSSPLASPPGEEVPLSLLGSFRKRKKKNQRQWS